MRQILLHFIEKVFVVCTTFNQEVQLVFIFNYKFNYIFFQLSKKYKITYFGIHEAACEECKAYPVQFEKDKTTKRQMISRVPLQQSFQSGLKILPRGTRSFVLFYFIFMTVLLFPFCTLWMIGPAFECEGVFLYQLVALLIVVINSFCKGKDLSICFPTFRDSIWSFSPERLTLLRVRNILNFFSWLRTESKRNYLKEVSIMGNWKSLSMSKTMKNSIKSATKVWKFCLQRKGRHIAKLLKYVNRNLSIVCCVELRLFLKSKNS